MLFTATGYPGDYGFVPDTLAEDGDPIDVLLLLDEPTFPGCVVKARIIAVYWMGDEAGPGPNLRGRPRRQAAGRAGGRPPAGAPAGTRGRADVPDRRDLALLRHLQASGARQDHGVRPLGPQQGGRRRTGGRPPPVRRSAHRTSGGLTGLTAGRRVRPARTARRPRAT